jgi:hypothetical protein
MEFVDSVLNLDEFKSIENLRTLKIDRLKALLKEHDQAVKW